MLVCEIAYRAKVNYNDFFSQVKMWEQLIYCHVLDTRKILPPAKESKDREEIDGAYVKAPRPGRYGWTASVDATSLYPSLDIMFNISPETMGELLHDVTPDSFLRDEIPEIPDGYCLAANGQTFSNKSTGFIPEIMESLFAERARHKANMNNKKRELEKLKIILKKRGLK